MARNATAPRTAGAQGGTVIPTAARLPYEPPEIQFWTAKELNAIEATMSGGRGGFPAYCFVNLLNNLDGISKDNGIPFLGHAAIMIQSPDSWKYRLYNFGPKDNKTADLEGAVGVFADGELCFMDFQSKCHNGGVMIDNGSMKWPEGFDRYIEIKVRTDRCLEMIEFAERKMANPPHYNVLNANGINCLKFVEDVLSHVGITLFDASGRNMSSYPMPNSYFDSASYCSGGIGFHAARNI